MNVQICSKVHLYFSLNGMYVYMMIGAASVGPLPKNITIAIVHLDEEICGHKYQNL